MAGNLRKLNDQELVLRIKNNGDQLAYASLMEKYQKSIFYTTLKMINNRDDAEDITMQAFTKAFKNLDAYDTKYAFSTWLFKIASNTSIDFIRKKRLQTTSLDNQLNDDEEGGTSFSSMIADDNNLDPQETMVLAQRNRIMKEMVEKLNPKYRDLIQLRFFEELKYEEIADRLNLPIGTVKVRLSRAKALLTEILTKNAEHFSQ